MLHKLNAMTEYKTKPYLQYHDGFGSAIETRILEGEDVAQTVIDFARRNQITQIYLSRPHERLRLPWLYRDLVQRIVALARDMQIVIVSERDPVLQDGQFGSRTD